jgi:hypothetical protein
MNADDATSFGYSGVKGRRRLIFAPPCFCSFFFIFLVARARSLRRGGSNLNQVKFFPHFSR